jgi:hypothetical protein
MNRIFANTIIAVPFMGRITNNQETALAKKFRNLLYYP